MHKRLAILLAAAVALPLAGCGPNGISSAGSKAIVGADATYIAASRAGMALVQFGKLDGETFRAADDRAYTALLLLRSAARGGDNIELQAGIATFNQALAAVRALAQ